jgi:DNA-binding CsgD family transcriptional regulator
VHAVDAFVAVANILAKFGVHSQLQAVLFALLCGAVDLR